MVLHLEPDDKLCLRSISVASRYVAELIMERSCRNSEHEMRSLLGELHQFPMWSSVRGSLFEQLAHTLLCKGGTFQLHALNDAAVSSVSTPGVIMDASSKTGLLTLAACQRCSFAASGLADKVAEWSSNKPTVPEYLVPESATYPGIDALMMPHFLFQVSQTEGGTGSHQSWQSGETREGAAQNETTQHSGKVSVSTIFTRC